MLVYRRLGHSMTDSKLHNIKEYTKEDLMDPEKIKMLCRMYCAYDIHITKSGWKFLIEYYGYEGLYEIDKSCGFGFYSWNFSEHKDNSLEEYIKWINGRIESYPEVPDFVYKADTPEGIARDALAVGKTAEEVMELFEMSFEYVRELDKEVKEEEAKRERKWKTTYAFYDLRHGKTIEEIAKERDLPIEYVQECYNKYKENIAALEKMKPKQ